MDVDGGVCRHDVAHQARPDVYGDELPQPRPPGQDRGHRRRDLWRSDADGHRRRLVRTRMAGLRIRLSPAPAGGWRAGRGGRGRERRVTGPAPPRAGGGWARRDEGVQIMRAAWRDGKVTFHGEQYHVDGAIVAPKPLQPGGLPLWIAGGGERKTLRIAAKYAQYTNYTAEPEPFAHKSEILAKHCRDVGTDFDAIVRSANFNAVVGASEADLKERLERIRGRLVPYVGDAAADAMITATSGPESATGTTEQVVEKLQRTRGLG